MNRCLEPRVGVKVLSYDLLQDAERAQVDAHLRSCRACRDLKEQTFGNAGAFRELEYRAFRLSQRQTVHVHEWFWSRMRALWLPLSAVAVLLGLLLAQLGRQQPRRDPVRIVRLATYRGAHIDSAATAAVPAFEPAPASFAVQPDRNAIALVYEVGDVFMRRLIPGAEDAPPILIAAQTIELAIPPLESPASRLLLILAPAPATSAAGAWDGAVQRRLNNGGNISSAGSWPDGAVPTLRWVH